MRVEPLTPAREDAWRAFLATRPAALAYQSLPYRDLLLEHLGCRAEYLLALDEAGQVRAVLPLMWHDGVLNSLPYYGSIGGIQGDDASAVAALAEAWKERACAEGTRAATLVTNPLDAGPELVHNHTDERIGQLTPLPADATQEALLALIDSSARRNVRKAVRLGISVERSGADIDA